MIKILKDGIMLILTIFKIGETIVTKQLTVTNGID